MKPDEIKESLQGSPQSHPSPATLDTKKPVDIVDQLTDLDVSTNMNTRHTDTLRYKGYPLY